jgi:hypothetical protein
MFSLQTIIFKNLYLYLHLLHLFGHVLNSPPQIIQDCLALILIFLQLLKLNNVIIYIQFALESTAGQLGIENLHVLWQKVLSSCL